MAKSSPYQQPIYLKALLQATTGEGSEKVFRFRASTAMVDRQGEVVTADGWELENFKRNPVFLLAHDYSGLPIGKVVELEQDPQGLIAGVVFDELDTQAQLVRSKYERGFLNAVSVGFMPIDIAAPKGGEPLKHTRKELLEISSVAVPANAEALQLRMLPVGILARLILDADGELVLPGGNSTRAAVPAHTSPMADEGRAWDANAAMGRMRALCSSDGSGDMGMMQWDRYRQGFAWLDSGNPEQLGSYKLPHHDVADGGMVVVWSGVAAAMAALMGARGGVDIPDGDRRAVYNHLARHYQQFDKTPPEFRSVDELRALTQEEIYGLFWEGETKLLEPPAAKAGRVLSRKNEDKLRQAAALLTEVLSAVEQDGEPPKTEGAEPSGDLAFDVDLSALTALLGRT